MFAATTSPWYLPTWVSSRTPVTSPTAHSPSPACRRASTGMPRAPAVMPTVSSPAGGHEQVVAAQFVAVAEGQDIVVADALRGGRVHTQEQLDAVGAQYLAEC